MHGNASTTCSSTDALSEALVLQALRDIGRRISKMTSAQRPYDVPDAEWWLTLHARSSYDASEYARFQSQWAWNHLPILLDAHGCTCFSAAELAAVLDQYVRDLVYRHIPHTSGLLQARIMQMAQFASAGQVG